MAALPDDRVARRHPEDLCQRRPATDVAPLAAAVEQDLTGLGTDNHDQA
jgi:hypothetical protein